MSEHKPSIEHPLYRAFLFGHFMFLVAVFLVLSMFLPLETDEGETPPEMSPPGVSFDLAARYALGMAEFVKTPSFQVAETQQIALITDLATGLAPAALSPSEQLAYAAILAELEGETRADAYLKNLDRTEWPDQAQSVYQTLLAVYTNSAWHGDEAAGAQLSDTLGVYGTLANTFRRDGLPASLEETAQQVREKPRRTAVRLVIWMGLGFLLFAAAWPTAAVLAWRFKKGAARWGQDSLNQKLPTHRAAFLEAMSAFMWFFILFATLSAWLPMMFQWLAFALPVVWLGVRGTDIDHIIFGVGLHRGAGGPVREMLSGVVGYLAGIPILLLGFLMTLALMQQTGSTASHPVVGLFAEGGLLQKINLFLMACVAAPIFEEIIFRGIFYHYLRNTAAAAGAALVSAVFFAILHPQGFAAVPMLTAIGFVLAMIREWRGSLIASMTAHALNNLIPLSLLMIFYGS